MSKIIKLLTKAPEAKSENAVSQIHKPQSLQSMNSSVERILFLQRTVGNQVVQRMLNAGVNQAKLKIGEPRDIYEQEADWVAEQVMQMQETTALANEFAIRRGRSSTIQRLYPDCQKILRRRRMQWDKENISALQFSRRVDAPLIQREAVTDEAEEVSENILLTKPKVTPPKDVPLFGRVESLKSHGQPLTNSDRVFFEPRLGHDFRHVRVHTDSSSAMLARTVNARAFTYGNHIAFGAGEYSPNTFSGRQLLAHVPAHAQILC